MFLIKPGRPTKIKRVIYYALAVLLGLLLSLIAHALIEWAYLSAAMARGLKINFSGGCALPPLAQTALWSAGAFCGYLFGRSWWRYLYTERRWERK